MWRSTTGTLEINEWKEHGRRSSAVLCRTWLCGSREAMQLVINGKTLISGCISLDRGSFVGSSLYIEQCSALALGIRSNFLNRKRYIIRQTCITLKKACSWRPIMRKLRQWYFAVYRREAVLHRWRQLSASRMFAVRPHEVDTYQARSSSQVGRVPGKRRFLPQLWCLVVRFLLSELPNF